MTIASDPRMQEVVISNDETTASRTDAAATNTMNYIQRKVLTIEIFLPNIFLQSVIMGLSVNTNLGPCIKIKLGSLYQYYVIAYKADEYTLADYTKANEGQGYTPEELAQEYNDYISTIVVTPGTINASKTAVQKKWKTYSENTVGCKKISSEVSYTRQTLLFIIIITDSNLSYYYQNYFAFTLFTLEAFPAISAPDSLVAIGTIL